MRDREIVASRRRSVCFWTTFVSWRSLIILLILPTTRPKMIIPITAYGKTSPLPTGVFGVTSPKPSVRIVISQKYSASAIDIPMTFWKTAAPTISQIPKAVVWRIKVR